MINLIIGGVDVSTCVNVESYNMAFKPQYDENVFTNYDGNEEKSLTGGKYYISLTLEKIPTSVVKPLAAAMLNDNIAVTFTDLLAANTDMTTTANFERPEIIYTLMHELDDGDYWDYTINLTSKLVPASGGL